MAIVAIFLLAALLAVVTAQWLVLRAHHRQRGIFRRWPVPKVNLEEIDPRFLPAEFGPTLATEVTFMGRGTIAVPGGTSDTEAWILAVLAHGARRLFEFGTCTGKTAYLWAGNLPAGGEVVTLTLSPADVASYQPAAGDDAVAEQYARQESRFSRFLYTGTPVEDRIIQLYGDSKRFDESAYARSCDVVFVDGSHARSYVLSDSEKALRMVRPGGLVLWHDYSPACPGVFAALNALARRLPLRHIRGTTLVAHRATLSSPP